MLLSDRGGGALARGLVTRLSALGDTPQSRRLSERFYSGVLGLAGQPEEEFLDASATAFQKGSFEDQVEVFYRLGLVSRSAPGFPFSRGPRPRSFAQLSAQVREAMIETLATRVERDPASVGMWIDGTHNSEETLNAALALLCGYLQERDTLSVAQFVEEAQHAVDQTFHEWRYRGPPVHGNAIDYLGGEQAFWEILARNESMTLRGKLAKPNEISSLRSRYDILRTHILDLAASSNSFFEEQLEMFMGLRDPAARKRRIADIQAEIGRITQELGEVSSPPERNPLLVEREELQRLLTWIRIELAFEEFGRQGRFTEPGKVAQDVRFQERYFRIRGMERVADDLRNLAVRIEVLKSRESGRAVVVRETDDFDLILRMGAASPDLVNCFSPNGSPDFNRYALTVAGSKSMKVLYVPDARGEPNALFVYKVKRHASGNTVLYLEPGLFAAHDYAEEMLRFLHRKAAMLSAAGYPTRVMVYDPNATDEVHGVGAYTNKEYVEPLFRWRHAVSVRHRGRLVDPPEELPLFDGQNESR
jgi:hypothetical protein